MKWSNKRKACFVIHMQPCIPAWHVSFTSSHLCVFFFFFGSLHLAFITLYSTFSCSCFILLSPWPWWISHFLILHFLLPEIFAPPSYLFLFFHTASSPGTFHSACYLSPFILPPISPSFLLSLEWSIFFHPFRIFLSLDALWVALSPLCFYSPSHFHHHPFSNPLSISSSHTDAQWQALFMYSPYV